MGVMKPEGFAVQIHNHPNILPSYLVVDDVSSNLPYKQHKCCVRVFAVGITRALVTKKLQAYSGVKNDTLQCATVNAAGDAMLRSTERNSKSPLLFLSAMSQISKLTGARCDVW